MNSTQLDILYRLLQSQTITVEEVAAALAAVRELRARSTSRMFGVPVALESVLYVRATSVEEAVTKAYQWLGSKGAGVVNLSGGVDVSSEPYTSLLRPDISLSHVVTVRGFSGEAEEAHGDVS